MTFCFRKLCVWYPGEVNFHAKLDCNFCVSLARIYLVSRANTFFSAHSNSHDTEAGSSTLETILAYSIISSLAISGVPFAIQGDFSLVIFLTSAKR